MVNEGASRFPAKPVPVKSEMPLQEVNSLFPAAYVFLLSKVAKIPETQR
jgi:hypothetical protein